MTATTSVTIVWVLVLTEFSDNHYSRSPLEIVHLLIICGAFWDGGYCGAFANDTERYATTSPECDGSTD